MLKSSSRSHRVVAQVSKPAVSPTSSRQGVVSVPLRIWKSATRQVWKPALQASAVLLGVVILGVMPASAALAKPTPQQVVWQDYEIGMFVHFAHAAKLENVNPGKLNTDQWVSTAEAMGAKYFMFVAKHEDGFCWWQTETSPYGVKQTPWRGGQGDVVKELAESCRRRGMKLGIYLSPGDAVFRAAVHGVCKTPAEQEIYNKVYRAQLTELLTRSGEIHEVWFDGSTVAGIGDILQQHAPKAMIFQTPHATIRWVGNERGTAPYPAWNSVPKARAKTGIATAADGRPDGDVWLPNECDTRTRVGSWFWSPDPKNRLKTLDELISIYYQSVGRGAQLLLNIGPDPAGLIPDEDVQRMCDFGAEVQRRLGKSAGETSGRGDTVELDLPRPVRIEHIITMEEISEGERVREYVVEGFVDDQWKELAKGTAIGHKKIDRFVPVAVSKVRLRIVKSAAEPFIRRLAAFAAVGEGGKVSGQEALPVNAAPAKIWEWSARNVGSEWTTVDLDLTPHCKEACPYQVEFRAAAGGQSLEIQSLNLVYEGTLVPGFVQRAPPGDVPRFFVTITALGKTLGLRAVVRAASGQKNSQGAMTVGKRSP